VEGNLNGEKQPEQWKLRQIPPQQWKLRQIPPQQRKLRQIPPQQTYSKNNRSLSESDIPKDVDPQFGKILNLLENLGKKVQQINEKMERIKEDREREREEQRYSVDMSQTDLSQILDQDENLMIPPQTTIMERFTGEQEEYSVIQDRQKDIRNDLMMEQARQRVHELEQQQLMTSVGHGSNYTTIQPQIDHN
jgi:hypothetical protein